MSAVLIVKGNADAGDSVSTIDCAFFCKAVHWALVRSAARVEVDATETTEASAKTATARRDPS
jgi:hypothetical protein